jgi:hypothetical protein
VSVTVTVIVVALVLAAFVAFVAHQARMVLRPEYDEYNARMDAERWLGPPQDATPAAAERPPGVEQRRGPATA